jgi:hypothetical protein
LLCAPGLQHSHRLSFSRPISSSRTLPCISLDLTAISRNGHLQSCGSTIISGGVRKRGVQRLPLLMNLLFRRLTPLTRPPVVAYLLGRCWRNHSRAPTQTAKNDLPGNPICEDTKGYIPMIGRQSPPLSKKSAADLSIHRRQTQAVHMPPQRLS